MKASIGTGTGTGEQGLSSRIRQEVAQGRKQVQTSLGAKKELSIIQKDNQ